MNQERRNSKGELLVFDEEIKCWVPQWVRDDPKKHIDYSRFSHPKFSWISITLNVIIPVIISGIMTLCLYYFFYENNGFFSSIPNLLLLSLGFLLLYTIIRLKSLAIFTVKLYQKFAPMRIRERCVFTPTCSDYMILAIQKYGLIKGIKKGRDRLKRCHGQLRDDWP